MPMPHSAVVLQSPAAQPSAVVLLQVVQEQEQGLQSLRQRAVVVPQALL